MHGYARLICECYNCDYRRLCINMSDANTAKSHHEVNNEGHSCEIVAE